MRGGSIKNNLQNKIDNLIGQDNSKKYLPFDLDYTKMTDKQASIINAFIDSILDGEKNNIKRLTTYIANNDLYLKN